MNVVYQTDVNGNHVLIRSNAVGINTRLDGADATNYRCAGLGTFRYLVFILTPRSGCFVASAPNSRAIYCMVLSFGNLLHPFFCF